MAAYISFTGITDCKKAPGFIPPPGNYSVEVVQREGVPCFYEAVVGDWAYEYLGSFMGSCVVNQTWQNQNMFKGVNDVPCLAWFANTLVCAAGFVSGEGGEAAVMFNAGHVDGSLGSLMYSINMEPGPKTKFDFWPASDKKICVRFARKKDATNILILVEPTEL
ncbi:MAG TPA: hypothetical protein VMW50_03755 [Dehalococcoidia bacterium]|nr:hypothetical protein [Dehalococcoidia bacterium]